MTGSGSSGSEPSAMDLLHAGLAKARAGDIASAGTLIDRGLALEPRNPSILAGRAIIYRVEGRMRDAVLACEEAIRRPRRCASSGQVRKGLYGGSGQRTPYAEWLEPVMPVLRPWIDKLDYS